MRMKGRITTLEKAAKGRVLARDRSHDALAQRLIGTAERLSGVPLEEVLANPTPVEIASLIFTGRTGERVAALGGQYAAQGGAVGRLFSVLMEASQ